MDRRTTMFAIVAVLLVIGAASAYVAIYQHREKTIHLSFVRGDAMANASAGGEPLELTEAHLVMMPPPVIAGLDAALSTGLGYADLNAKQEAEYFAALGDRRDDGRAIHVMYKGALVSIGAQSY